MVECHWRTLVQEDGVEPGGFPGEDKLDSVQTRATAGQHNV